MRHPTAVVSLPVPLRHLHDAHLPDLGDPHVNLETVAICCCRTAVVIRYGAYGLGWYPLRWWRDTQWRRKAARLRAGAA